MKVYLLRPIEKKKGKKFQRHSALSNYNTNLDVKPLKKEYMLITIFEEDYDLEEVYLLCMDIRAEIYDVFKGRSMQEGDLIEKGNNDLFICTKNGFEQIEWKNDN